MAKDMKFKSQLFRYPGPGGWTFARIPEKHAPAVTAPWGRTPVLATIDGRECKTSVWRDKKHGTLLPIAKAMRGDKGDGDTVTIELRVTTRSGSSSASSKTGEKRHWTA